MTIKRAITMLHIFVGIGALGGGAIALFDPYGEKMRVSVEALVYGPFTKYFISGLFLLFILGFGNIFAGIITMRRWRVYPYINILMGVILCVWIIIQCHVLFAIHFLHILYFLIGLAQLALGFMHLQRIYMNKMEVHH